MDALGGNGAQKENKEIFDIQKSMKDVIDSNENLQIRVKGLENSS